MLESQEHGTSGPLVVLLHWLGGSARSWNEVAEGLAQRGYRIVAIDLPGFGLSAGQTGYDIRSMTDAVLATIRSLRSDEHADTPWLIGGHSMGGTVATAIARDALDGSPGLGNLRGLILVSPSPPGPEPMDEKQRRKLIDTLGQPQSDGAQARKDAESFVDENTGKLPLPEGIRARTLDDVLRAAPAAMRSWLEHGSREDWRQYIGHLPVPVLIFAGTEDAALGPDAQREHTLPHFTGHAELVTLPRAGHLAPLERPGELTLRIAAFAAAVGTPAQRPGHALGQSFRKLIDSDATAPQTRAALEQRLEPFPAPYTPQVFDPEEFLTLQALVECVIPRDSFDLPACLDRTLATTPRDGWRFDALPPDPEAWRTGLRSLDAAATHAHSVPFIALYPDQQHALLEAAAAGKLDKRLLGTLHLGPAASLFSAAQMQHWFEDVRGELTRLYVADPRTLELIGYTGFADNHGFTRIRLGEREDFEQ